MENIPTHPVARVDLRAVRNTIVFAAIFAVFSPSDMHLSC
jgi:hypothetical protein